MVYQFEPIETAPRDGTRIQLYYPAESPYRDERKIVGAWSRDQHARKPRPYWTNDQERLWGVRDLRDNPPTHWAPLLPSPSAAGARTPADNEPETNPLCLLRSRALEILHRLESGLGIMDWKDAEPILREFVAIVDRRQIADSDWEGVP